jgi:hypothetical protein
MEVLMHHSQRAARSFVRELEIRLYTTYFLKITSLMNLLDRMARNVGHLNCACSTFSKQRWRKDSQYKNVLAPASYSNLSDGSFLKQFKTFSVRVLSDLKIVGFASYLYIYNHNLFAHISWNYTMIVHSSSGFVFLHCKWSTFSCF